MRSLLLLPLMLLSTVLVGQDMHDQSAFRPLDLPAPNVYRAASGRPGHAYWQQRVDYRITATLDAAANVLSGRETIRYANNSPDTLTYLWMHLEQNICAANSVTNRLNQPPLVFQDATFDFSCQGFAGGLTLETVAVAGRPLAHSVYGTTMRVDLPAPLAPEPPRRRAQPRPARHRMTVVNSLRLLRS